MSISTQASFAVFLLMLSITPSWGADNAQPLSVDEYLAHLDEEIEELWSKTDELYPRCLESLGIPEHQANTMLEDAKKLLTAAAIETNELLFKRLQAFGYDTQETKLFFPPQESGYVLHVSNILPNVLWYNESNFLEKEDLEQQCLLAKMVVWHNFENEKRWLSRMAKTPLIVGWFERKEDEASRRDSNDERFNYQLVKVIAKRNMDKPYPPVYLLTEEEYPIWRVTLEYSTIINEQIIPRLIQYELLEIAKLIQNPGYLQNHLDYTYDQFVGHVPPALIARLKSEMSEMLELLEAIYPGLDATEEVSPFEESL